MKKKLYAKDLVQPFFKGIGQIMLQSSLWAGLFFLAGIFCGSFAMGLAATLAVLTGTYTAVILKYDKQEIDEGLYGFSATLVGVALLCMFQSSVLIWLLVVLGSILAVLLQHFFIVKRIPAFTFPFIIVTWLLLFVFSRYPDLVLTQPEVGTIGASNYLTILPRGFGQVIFQSNIWAGILFIVAVFISKPIAAIYGIGGAAISGLLAYQLGESLTDICCGLLSYNAVLCAITFAGKRYRDGVLVLMAVTLSTIIMIQMRKMQLPALTFPFVFASWFTLLVKARFYS